MNSRQRQKLISGVDELNRLVHELELYVQDLEADNQRLRETVEGWHNPTPNVAGDDRRIKLERLFRMVWIAGASVYSPEVQKIVDELN